MELILPTDYAKEKIRSVQDYAVLAVRSLGNLFKRPLYVADMIQQADLIGFGSLPIVLAACFFTGAALALNSASTLDRFGAIEVAEGVSSDPELDTPGLRLNLGRSGVRESGGEAGGAGDAEKVTS